MCTGLMVDIQQRATAAHGDKLQIPVFGGYHVFAHFLPITLRSNSTLQ